MCLDALQSGRRQVQQWASNRHLGCRAHDNGFVDDAEVDFRELQRPAVAAASIGGAVHAAAMVLAAAICVAAAVVEAGIAAAGASSCGGVSMQTGCCQFDCRRAAGIWAVPRAAVYKGTMEKPRGRA